ncbi:uncharacterized protein LOC134273759 [Saccostrea cucullata]|uniref:uncharacterized protein LOC134273759 n=1 Tax=Saccostrea cuccullata TaxID=36930 RepID=UPI002ED2FE8F
MKVNTKSEEPITLNNEEIEEVSEFVYLGSKITTDGNSEVDVLARISKATGAYVALRNIWRSAKISTNTKIRIFKSNVLGVLLYGAEAWKVTKTISNKLDTFQTRCLRRILRIFWPNTISNEELYKKTNTTPLSQVIKRRKWLWIGHVRRMHPTSIPRVALKWTPPGKRKRERPKETWRRSVEKEMGKNRWTWGQIQKWTQDRPAWKSLVTALCAIQHEED